MSTNSLQYSSTSSLPLSYDYFVTPYECGICKNTELTNSDFVFLNCDHVFHKECIEQWVNYVNTRCPICDKEICEVNVNKITFVEEYLKFMKRWCMCGTTELK